MLIPHPFPSAQFMSPAGPSRSGSMVSGGSSALSGGSAGGGAAPRTRDVTMGQLFEVFELLSQQVRRVGREACKDGEGLCS